MQLHFDVTLSTLCLTSGFKKNKKNCKLRAICFCFLPSENSWLYKRVLDLQNMAICIGPIRISSKANSSCRTLIIGGLYIQCQKGTYN